MGSSSSILSLETLEIAEAENSQEENEQSESQISQALEKLQTFSEEHPLILQLSELLRSNKRTEKRYKIAAAINLTFKTTEELAKDVFSPNSMLYQALNDHENKNFPVTIFGDRELISWNYARSLQSAQNRVYRERQRIKNAKHPYAHQDSKEVLYKDPKKTVTIYIWETDYIKFAAKKVHELAVNGYSAAKNMFCGTGENGETKRISPKQYLGHVALEIGDPKDPDTYEYVSLWGSYGAIRSEDGQETGEMSVGLHSKDSDENYFAEKRGKEGKEKQGQADKIVKLYGLDVQKMKDAIAEFKARGLTFNLGTVWIDDEEPQYNYSSDERRQYNCSSLIQALLNIGGAWSYLEPFVNVESGFWGGFATGATSGAITGAVMAMGTVVPAQGFVAGIVIAAGVIFLGSAVTGGAFAALIMSMIGLGPVLAALTCGAAGGAAGAAFGALSGKISSLIGAEKRFMVTPNDLVTVINLFEQAEQRKYYICDSIEDLSRALSKLLVSDLSLQHTTKEEIIELKEKYIQAVFYQLNQFLNKDQNPLMFFLASILRADIIFEKRYRIACAIDAGTRCFDCDKPIDRTRIKEKFNQDVFNENSRLYRALNFQPNGAVLFTFWGDRKLIAYNCSGLVQTAQCKVLNEVQQNNQASAQKLATLR